MGVCSMGLAIFSLVYVFWKWEAPFDKSPKALSQTQMCKNLIEISN
jgi:hypothetical protein